MDTLRKKYAMQLVIVVGAHESLRFGEIEAHLPGASTSTICSISASLSIRERSTEVLCNQINQDSTVVQDLAQLGWDLLDVVAEDA